MFISQKKNINSVSDFIKLFSVEYSGIDLLFITWKLQILKTA